MEADNLRLKLNENVAGPSHAQLVSFGAVHLESTRRCFIVLQEKGSWGEFPDLIGWTYDLKSILIEAKTSRADFLADQKKLVRQNSAKGMGRERWYLTPKGLLDPVDLPPGWGLLEARGSRIYRVWQGTTFDDYNAANEQRLALLTLRDWEYVSRWYKGPTGTWREKHQMAYNANRTLWNGKEEKLDWGD